jgi:hypothetical protein
MDSSPSALEVLQQLKHAASSEGRLEFLGLAMLLYRASVIRSCIWFLVLRLTGVPRSTRRQIIADAARIDLRVREESPAKGTPPSGGRLLGLHHPGKRGPRSSTLRIGNDVLEIPQDEVRMILAKHLADMETASRKGFPLWVPRRSSLGTVGGHRYGVYSAT